MRATNRSAVSLVATWALSLVVLPVTGESGDRPDEYVKRTTWQETMLASRGRLAPLLAEQQRRLQLLAIEPWHTTGPLVCRRFSDALFPEENVDLNACDEDGQPLWRQRDDWIDGWVHMLENHRQATYLFRTITAGRAVTVTAHVGSDNGMKIWLNGKEIFFNEKLGLRRHQHATVDLALVRGENRLLIKAYNETSTAGFYFSLTEDAVFRVWRQIEKDFPVQWDWVLQDAGEEFRHWFRSDRDTRIESQMIDRALVEVDPGARPLREQLELLQRQSVSADDPRWLDLYVESCQARRTKRLATLLELHPKIVFTKHRNLGGTHYAYTECQSDAQRERSFLPTASLCLFEMEGLQGTTRTLLDDPDGMIRDPDVSFDARRVLFSWKKSDRKDDFHLHELDLASGRIRQLTFGLGFADYEGAYLPDGNIVFNSTRCVQTVDCWWTEVSNLYTCDGDGKYLRRLCYDQVHTNFPSVASDGRVLYTRWEYNDRGQGMVQPLFVMNPDGTGQTEFYGNNSWFPTSILHARGIPGTQQVVAIAGGHHARQSGKLIRIDPAMGRQENHGVELIAPRRHTPAERIDPYGQFGEQFQYPYPITPTEFLVAYEPVGWGRERLGDELLFGSNVFFSAVKSGEILDEPALLTYKNYWMDIDGRRELLMADPDISCNQPIPLTPRNVAVRPNLVDYRDETGTYYVYDIYRGPGLEGIERGTVKKLRVVGLDFRAAGIGSNVNRGPAAGAIVSTPKYVDEVPKARRLASVPLAEVLAVVAGHYEVDASSFAKKHSKQAGRDIAAWMARRVTTATLRELSMAFGLGHPDSIRNLIRRADQQIERSPMLRKQVEQMLQSLRINPENQV